jgi:rSAM/selenodomain-associated transferase 1
VNLVVLAKAPVAGRSKTRLCPPCRPDEAAAIAEASLADTLAAASRARFDTYTLALEGEPGRWLPAGVRVVPQRGGGLDERIAGALQDVGGEAVLIGMDTPQATTSLLNTCAEELGSPGTDAVLGEAVDGGWWVLGMRRPSREAFIGVPMSTDVTAVEQRRRLVALGLRVGDLPVLRDVDRFHDAVTVSSDVPGSRFERTVHRTAIAIEERRRIALGSA